MSSDASIFTIFLHALGVKATAGYSDSRFLSMPFKSLFGFSRLLKEYGIDCDGLYFADKSKLTALPCPCLVQENGHFVVLDGITGSTVRFKSTSGSKERDIDAFTAKWSGVALVAYPTADSCEPDYQKHRFMEAVGVAKRVVLALCLAFLAVWFFIAHGIYTHWWTIATMLLYMAGIYISRQLMLKSLNIHTKAGNRICGVIEQGGCDTVLEQKASTFFGIFSWSEVGLAYFTVSLGALMLFPGRAHWLAALNVCCLPFSFWSVWYQKFRAKAWCTMCLTVQALLWIIFICNLTGGAFSGLSFAEWTPLVLIAAYGAALMGYNALADMYKSKKPD